MNNVPKMNLREPLNRVERVVKYKTIQMLYDDLCTSYLCVFVQVSDKDAFNDKFLNRFFNKHKVTVRLLEVGLIARMTKNPHFLHVCNGRTKTFFFRDIDNMLKFFEIFPVGKKHWPMSVFYRNDFYLFEEFVVTHKKKGICYATIAEIKQYRWLPDLRVRLSKKIFNVKVNWTIFLAWLHGYSRRW